MFCKSCGSPLPDGLGHCPNCGTPVFCVDSTIAYRQQYQHVTEPRNRNLKAVLVGVACVLSIGLIAAALVLGGVIPAGTAYAQGMVQMGASVEGTEIAQTASTIRQASTTVPDVTTIRIETEPVDIDVDVDVNVDGTVPGGGYYPYPYYPAPAPAPAPSPAPAPEPRRTTTTTTYGTYIVPDSNTRWYSRSELEYLSTYDLYLARNEIFARHGRRFVRDDLQRHFDAQGWYYGYIAPEDFDYNVLSSTEAHNVEVMKQIEQSRNSPYL